MIKDDELLEKIYTRFDTFEQLNRPYHNSARVSRDVVRLRDPGQDAPGEEPTLQLHTLKSTFNNVVADQMNNLPEAKLIPETIDKKDAVEDLQDLVHYVVYEANDFVKVHRKRVEDFYATGTAITQIYWDSELNHGRGDIALIRWPVEAFIWDPQVDDIQNSRCVMKIIWHPMSWYKEHYPDDYEHIEASEDKEGLPETQRARSNDEPRAMMIEYWYREYKNGKYTINLAVCAGNCLLSVHKNVYKHGLYPFVIDVHDEIEGSVVGEGLITEMTPMMRYINKYAKYIDTNLRMSSKGRLLTRKNSGINREDLADWSKDIIEGDSVTQGEDWNWMQHAPFNGMIANQMLQFQADLKQDAGANQFTRGETTGGIVSGKAILALQNAGGKIQNLRTTTLNNGFKDIVKQILWLMSQFYDAKRVAMVTGRSGIIREVSADTERFFGTGKEISPPPYIVQVEVSVKDPVRVEAQNEMFMQAYTMAAQAQQYFPLSALFEILNVDGKDRILPVIRENENTQQVMQQMQSQIEEQNMQLEQLGKENQSLRNAVVELSGEENMQEMAD